MIGFNGARTSTRMRVLSGLLPASKGEIRRKDKAIGHCTSAELRIQPQGCRSVDQARPGSGLCHFRQVASASRFQKNNH
jgi:ABC-type cobalamin/Fe3+-siderophores transport system ATPase subunit